jgi:hypothetical protein
MSLSRNTVEIIFAAQKEIRLRQNDSKGNTMEIDFAPQKEILLRRNKATQ